MTDWPKNRTGVPYLRISTGAASPVIRIAGQDEHGHRFEFALDGADWIVLGLYRLHVLNGFGAGTVPDPVVTPVAPASEELDQFPSEAT